MAFRSGSKGGVNCVLCSALGIVGMLSLMPHRAAAATVELKTDPVAGPPLQHQLSKRSKMIVEGSLFAPRPASPATAPPEPSASALPALVPFADDGEYRLSGVNATAQAISAYQAGVSGTAIRIAIIDSGLADPRGEFTGRIDPASRDLFAVRGITDEAGHGTSVAAIAAAGRNGSDIMGIAYNATLLVERADTPGSCAAGGCAYDNGVIATAVDQARTAGARIINMSLGGAAVNGALSQAIGRATAAGIVVVIAAGNDGAGNPGALAQIAGQAGVNGMVVIAGSHDAEYRVSSFSNRAGNLSGFYLTAMGENVRAFNHLGTDMMFSGTSYAAPAISGAMALLLEAFPNLTARQAIDLLYASATDAGAPGVDAVFGQGILNLDNAFRPKGATRIAGSALPIAIAVNAELSPAMGDAGRAGSAGLLLLDSYDRAYHLDLGATLRRAPTGRSLVRALSGGHGFAFAVAGLRMSFVTSQGWRDASPLTMLSNRQAGGQRVLSGAAALRVGEHAQIRFGIAEAGTQLTGLVRQRDTLPWLAAHDTDVSPGFESRATRALAVSRTFGRLEAVIWAESGSAALPDRAVFRTAPEDRPAGYRMAGLSLTRSSGPVMLTAGTAVLREKSTLLGARLAPALGGSGASTLLLDLRGRWTVAPEWTLAGAWRQGWTTANRGGALTTGQLRTSAFSVDLQQTGAIQRFGFRIAQPLRVDRSRYRLNLPTALDPTTGAIMWEPQWLELAPRGRELDFEASYGRRLGPCWLNANLYLRRQPGNVRTAPADGGIAARYQMIF